MDITVYPNSKYTLAKHAYSIDGMNHESFLFVDILVVLF